VRRANGGRGRIRLIKTKHSDTSERASVEKMLNVSGQMERTMRYGERNGQSGTVLFRNHETRSMLWKEFECSAATVAVPSLKLCKGMAHE